MEAHINMFKIDYIFPYVDYEDSSWYNEYIKEFNKTEEIKTINDIVRYKDYGILKYKLHTLYKYMPWINNIYIIVSSESQIPEYIKQEYPNIKFIYHKDFIPEEFLPTFNSSVIEAFLPRIECLEEHFIYSNDDIIINTPLNYTDWFTEEGNPISDVILIKKDVKKYEVSNMLNSLLHNCIGLLKDIEYDGFIEDDNFIINANHSDKPFVKSVMLECYNKYKKSIHNSCTKFRDHKNISIYLYVFYQIFTNICKRKYTPSIGVIGQKLLKQPYLMDIPVFTISIDFNDDITENELTDLHNMLINKYM